MAPPAGFDTEQVRDKARKDLLYLLSVVSETSRELSSPAMDATQTHGPAFVDPLCPATLLRSKGRRTSSSSKASPAQ